MASARIAGIRVNGLRTFQRKATCIVLELVRPLRAYVSHEMYVGVTSVRSGCNEPRATARP
eukprot:16097946-Heterocapsa_arctica.AAC.1